MWIIPTMWGSTVTNDAICTWEIISRIVMANAALNKMLFAIKLDFSARKIILNCYI